MCLGQIYKDRIRYCGFLCLKSPENDIHSNNTSLYLEMVRPIPVSYCRPEPPCVVTDIPKRDIRSKNLNFFQAQGTIYGSTEGTCEKNIYLVPTT